MKRSDHRRKDAAAVDVRDQNGWRVKARGQTEIHQIALLEVQFGDAARAFNDDRVVVRGKPGVTCQHILEQEIEMAVVVGRPEIAPWLAIQHNLAAESSRGLQKNRIHVRMRLKAAGFSLSGLCAADLAASGAHHGVVGHVLRFERRDAMSHSIQIPAQRCSHPALADVGSRAADENCVAQAS